ncbi:hypothetical protein B1B_06545, partial [mine drainage metagenome]
TFTEPNGTYSFTVAAIDGYVATPSSGNVTVVGHAVTAFITYQPAYTVTFQQYTLPSGTSWSVTLNGTTRSSNPGGLTVTFVEPNGTYPFAVVPV